MGFGHRLNTEAVSIQLLLIKPDIKTIKQGTILSFRNIVIFHVNILCFTCNGVILFLN